ncbi:MAG TPA: hydroxymethylbilane synthase [Candidatus Limnocylindria bacterium]|nr:hydroxymethylbilane synthase [Candidatus Limnocylindria bacterium]
MRRLRLGTRGSRLAMAQATIAVEALRAVGAATSVELVTTETRGDTLSRRRPGGSWVTGDGQFTSDLERRLADGDVDLVVHSYKDLPTTSDPRLAVAAVLERGDPADCLLTGTGAGLAELRFGARIGTSSARRAAQLAPHRPDLVSVPIRGNVPSRIDRVRRGELDGVMLAVAGLERLGIRVPSGARLPFDVVLPAPAQGALAIQVRRDDVELVETVARADHAATRLAVEAERALLVAIGGGCLAPLGALAEVDGDEVRLRAAFETPTGALHRADERGSAAEIEALVARVAAQVAPLVVSA